MKSILEVHKISKRFKIRHQTAGYLSLRDQIAGFFTRKGSQSSEDFFALENVSFEIFPGESLAIVGKNGSGKSTLLKILSKITPPTSGRFITRGRIASLLEVGTGFHPELTGRENVFFNGSLLGMRRSEIDSKFDEIVDFSGVERFLDTPLKHFSSGMQLRLAFAVAAFLEPEILIIDEVLAVGDAEFQKKCLGKMEDVSRSGRTILFVSHNMAAVETLCQTGLLLSYGKVLKRGKIGEVTKAYQNSFGGGASSTYQVDVQRTEPLFVKSLSLQLSGIQPDLKLKLNCELLCQGEHRDAFMAIDFFNSIGTQVMQAIPKLEPFIKSVKGTHSYEVEVNLPPLIPDLYYVSIWLGSHNTETISWDEQIARFEIVDSPTKGRTFPHHHNRGSIVPISRILK